jgi:Protein of unknown function (DUF3164)
METVSETKKPTRQELLAQLKELEEQERGERVAYELMKSELVDTLCNQALGTEEGVKKLHENSMKQLMAFREVMNDYGDLPKNSKGGFSIANDRFKARLKIHNLGDFDERANIAERTLKVTDENSFELIMKLLERKKGKFEYARVMEILSYEDKYQDADWKMGCKLLKESFNHTGTKIYMEFEQKMEDGSWRKINLNLASL